MLSPHEFTIITSVQSNLGASLIASAKACEGSSEGEIFSSLETNLYALSASSSLAEVYLALFASLRKQCKEICQDSPILRK